MQGTRTGAGSGAPLEFVHHPPRTCPRCRRALEAVAPGEIATGTMEWFAQQREAGSREQWRSVTPPPDGTSERAVATFVCRGTGCGAVVYFESRLDA